MDLLEYKQELKRIVEVGDSNQRALTEKFQASCEHRNMFRNSFFVSTTAHEWDECSDCGKKFNYITFPA